MKTLSPLNPLKTLTAAAAVMAFASTAYAGDCSTKKAQKTGQYTSASMEYETKVLGASNANMHTVGYKKSKTKGTIVDAAIATDDLSTLVAAVKAADLVPTLSSEGPFTVFAPVNSAFSALPAGTVETLLKPENKSQLQGIFKAHVVAGKLKANDIISLAKANGGTVDVQTVSGDTLTAIVSGETLYVRDESGGLAGVAIADIKKSNGVVHVVDKVLLPVT